MCLQYQLLRRLRWHGQSITEAHQVWGQLGNTGRSHLRERLESTDLVRIKRVIEQREAESSIEQQSNQTHSPKLRDSLCSTGLPKVLGQAPVMWGSKETMVTLKGFCEQNPGDEEKVTVHNSKCHLVPMSALLPHTGRHTALTRHGWRCFSS